MITMQWITDKPVPSSGFNTIRKMSEKYENMKIGDTVSMELCYTADSKPFMTEQLTIKAIARSTGPHILMAYGKVNHSLRDISYNSRVELLTGYYGDLNDGEFIAVTFQ